MKARAELFYIGRTKDPSKKKGSVKYTFIEGEKCGNGYFNPTSVEHWDTQLYEFEFGKLYTADVEVQSFGDGMTVRVLQFLNPPKAVTSKS